MKEVYQIKRRTGKQIRERYHNYLNPEIKRTPITPEDELLIFTEYHKQGSKWATIAKMLNGKSENCVKNHFYSATNRYKKQIRQIFKESQKAVGKILSFISLADIMSQYDLAHMLEEEELEPEKLYEAKLSGLIEYEDFKEVLPKDNYEEMKRLMSMIFNHNKRLEDINKEKEQVMARNINVRKSERVRNPVMSINSVDITKVKSISNCRVKKGESISSKKRLGLNGMYSRTSKT